MNLQHLEYILAIEQYGSISKAAQNLYVSQPYLSKILKEVEDEYQISIFSRGKQGIHLTNTGQLFLDMARDLLSNAKRFQKTFEEKHDSYRLRVSSSAVSHSIDAFIRMINSLPEISLRFSYWESTNKQIIQDVYTHRADVGILFLNPSNTAEILNLMRDRRITHHKLFDSGTWITVREGHPLLSKKEPLTMEDLYQYNFVLYPYQRDAKTRALESSYGERSLSLINWSRIRQIIQVNSRSALHNILTNTDYLGIGVSPALEQTETFHITQIPFPADSPEKELKNSGNSMYYIYLKDWELSKAARVFITFLENYYGTRSGYSDSLKAYKIGS